MANVKYNPDYHDDWAWSLAMRGATDQEIADAIGVSCRTIMRWKKKHKSFAKALENGKNPADAKIMKTLYQRGLGYERKEKKSVIELDSATGRTKPIRIEETTVHVEPNVTALIFWLRNRCGWSNTPERTKQIELQNEKLLAEIAMLKQADGDESDTMFAKLVDQLINPSGVENDEIENDADAETDAGGE